jgi:hypothetical protein
VQHSVPTPLPLPKLGASLPILATEKHLCRAGLESTIAPQSTKPA